MSYKSNSELPESVKESLSEHGQDTYREAFNNAWEQYKEPSERKGNESREEVAHKVAWSAVKKIYEKDSKGNWVNKKPEKFSSWLDMNDLSTPSAIDIL
jgi:cation transport regulator